jgi:polyisoprenoid-binding protein YceI
VRTSRTGAAAKAGHDLWIEVTSWEATVELSEHGAVSLDADGASLHVLEGTGGITELGEDDKASIRQTIYDELLHGTPVAFRSTAVRAAGDGGAGSFTIDGELTMLGRTKRIAFELEVGADGSLRASAAIKQSDWGIKPYSALFGALKVADEVRVSFDGRPPPAPGTGSA